MSVVAPRRLLMCPGHLLAGSLPSNRCPVGLGRSHAWFQCCESSAAQGGNCTHNSPTNSRRQEGRDQLASISATIFPIPVGARTVEGFDISRAARQLWVRGYVGHRFSVCFLGLGTKYRWLLKGDPRTGTPLSQVANLRSILPAIR